MKCARCTADLPAQSRFCLQCGTPVPTGVPQVSKPEAAPAFSTPASASARSGANRGLKTAVACLAAAVIVLALIASKGLFHSPGSSHKGSLVNAPGESNGNGLLQSPGVSNNAPLLQSPGTSQAPPSLTQNPDQGPPRAADVEDYLRFVKEVEARKQKMIKEFTTAALMQSATEKGQEVEAASSDEASKKFLPNINKGNQDLAGKWDDLANELIEINQDVIHITFSLTLTKLNQ